jgi:hypothetical protein
MLMPGISLAPSLQAKKPFITLVDAAKETLLQLYLSDGQWSGHQHGGTGLWETVEQAYARWHRLGKPHLNAYHVECLLPGRSSVEFLLQHLHLRLSRPE